MTSIPAGRWRRLIASLIAALIIATPAHAALTAGARLAGIYDTILDARFDAAAAAIADACPTAPEGACRALRVVSLSWQILLNPEDRRLDGRFADEAASAIRFNEAWTAREPQRAEAWFYLAGSYAPRVQWRVLRGERLGAALDGKKIKDALERALQIDPTMNDAYFGIGLYHYYAAVAPAAARMLRFFLFLPGGDRAQGMAEMLRARDRGEVLRGEADYQLHVLYLWYEQKTAEALSLLEGLDRRFPHNPLFRQRIAEAREDYLHDHAGSAAAWQDLLSRALAESVAAPRTTEVRARLGLASAFSAMNRHADAIDQLQRVVNMRPEEPVGARARAERDLRVAIARSTRR